MKNESIKGELTITDTLDVKPNYAALGRKYDMDWKTVKKYHEGYEGKPKTRKKLSRLDGYKDEIIDKLSIKRVTVRGVYEFMVKKYGETFLINIFHILLSFSRYSYLELSIQKK